MERPPAARTSIFLSYARADLGVAKRIASTLEDLGFQVWWDVDLRGGEPFEEIIRRELDAATYVVVLWSKHSVRSYWVRAEANQGLRHQKLVQFRVANADVPLPFTEFHVADIRKFLSDTSDRLKAEILRNLSAGNPRRSETEVLRDSRFAAGLTSRWRGLLGGLTSGILSAGAYLVARDSSSVSIPFIIVGFLVLVGSSLGLLFEHIAYDFRGSPLKPKALLFVVKMILGFALSMVPVGGAAAKIMTDGCFEGIRTGQALSACKVYVGDSLLVFAAVVCAGFLTMGLFVAEDRWEWRKRAFSALVISVYGALAAFLFLHVMNVGDRYFNIGNPEVNPRTALIGGAILGGTFGGTIGLLASLMLLFVPEEPRMKPDPIDGS